MIVLTKRKTRCGRRRLRRDRMPRVGTGGRGGVEGHDAMRVGGRYACTSVRREGKKRVRRNNRGIKNCWISETRPVLIYLFFFYAKRRARRRVRRGEIRKSWLSPLMTRWRSRCGHEPLVPRRFRLCHAVLIRFLFPLVVASRFPI